MEVKKCIIGANQYPKEVEALIGLDITTLNTIISHEEIEMQNYNTIQQIFLNSLKGAILETYSKSYIHYFYTFYPFSDDYTSKEIEFNFNPFSIKFPEIIFTRMKINSFLYAPRVPKLLFNSKLSYGYYQSEDDALIIYPYCKLDAKLSSSLKSSKNISQFMVEKIPIIDWIDHETGVNAIEKTKNIKKKIVYLDYLMDLEKPTKKYEFLEIGPNDYFNN
ncbi:hypothetical protein H8356DRAFT_1349429 [Neocallimastix lanati (nom. inval.)]|nr:hypothetical protein H8356DRAFT_1349429 [Neocallimastix sp. JGI-2020a]